MDVLSQDIKYLKGVGPARAKLLGAELKVFTVRDLLYTFPYKYIDRTVIHTVSDLREDMPYVQLRGQLTDITTEGEGYKRRLKAIFFDGTGYIELVWFNAIKSIESKLNVKDTYLVFGKPTSFNGRFSIAHPEMDVVATSSSQLQNSTTSQLQNSTTSQLQDSTASQLQDSTTSQLLNALQPHYHTTEKMKRSFLTSRVLSELVRHALQLVGEKMTAEELETLPEYIRKEYQLAPLASSIQPLHFPTSADALPAATRRLKFDELFFLQLDILRYTKNRRINYAGFRLPRVGQNFLTFYNDCLPFPLTEAQKRVIREIRADMVTGRQMNRLLQGDVGSGKTIVALLVSLLAIDNGYQACLMAPTEILAEQHAATLTNLVKQLPVKVALLTGNVKGKARTAILRDVERGDIQLLVGTHALVEPTVKFHNLGLAIVDEQHRFGVKQRARLWNKNVQPPHILVMTATPIPRTLAMTVYGDLDVSVIDELPPGRKPIQTLHYTVNDTSKLYAGIRRQLAEGRQIYVVFPLIEESEKSDMRDLERGYEVFCENFPECRVGKVHGRMKPAEKDAAMDDFLQRRTQILVATTVIEVGVNVPNATVMVIENAERFGLSQLHQLRGRVGRGGDRSYCILVTGKDRLSETTERRIGIMTETTDGFRIAEEDLKLRGPGDLQGTEQSGLPFDLHVADVVRDADMMSVCREAAATVLKNDPYENLPQNYVLWTTLKRLSADRRDFSNIS